MRCGTTAPPSGGPPAIPETVRGEDRYLIDPRIGFDQPAPAKTETRFASAWRAFEAGDNAGARMLFDQIRKAHPDCLPATLGIAAIDIRDGRFDRATMAVERAQTKMSSYTAAEVYAAEIAARQNQLKRSEEHTSELQSHSFISD